MSARLVKWHRTHPGAGTTFSKCGRFSIRPAKSGREYVGFALKRKRTSSEPGQSQRSWYEDCGIYPAISAAKNKADAIMKTEAAERSDRRDLLNANPELDRDRVEGVLGALDTDERTAVVILYACAGLPIADLSGRYGALGLIDERSTISPLGRAVAKRILEDDPEARDPEAGGVGS